jgi:hypothetical protein
MHETYIYHPFSTRFNGQIHTEITTTPQILTSLNLPALGINRLNNKAICTICTTQTSSVANGTSGGCSASVSRWFHAWPDNGGNMFLRNIG